MMTNGSVLVANEEVAEVCAEVAEVSVEVAVEKKVVTWQEIDAKIAKLKAEAKALKALTNAKTGTSAKNPEEKLKALKAKWLQKSPLGSQLLGETVTFKPFGAPEPLRGICFSLVEDKRVPTVLLKIDVDGKIYHKDHKNINLEVFKMENDSMVEI